MTPDVTAVTAAQPDGAEGRDAAPFLRITWTDEPTGVPGHCVIDRLVNGVASGGLRMRAGLDVAEVADLARAMTVKEALAARPGMRRPQLGGGKGGIDLDPRHPEADAVLARFIEALVPICRDYWAFGEDLGLRQEQVDRAAAAAGLPSTLVAAYPLLREPPETAMERIDTAFAVEDAGIGIGDLVGGLGVARAAVTALRRSGHDPAGATAVVQGIGTIGGATARFLQRARLRVVAVADAAGTIADDAGLDIEALLAARDHWGVIDRSRLPRSARELPGDAWVEVPCDLLVPAAVSYCLDAPRAARVAAGLVVEGANLPCTEQGAAVLADRGIPVIPDVVANSATNSWWWWVFFGDVADPGSRQESYDLVESQMTDLVDEVLDTAEEYGILPRAAVTVVARARSAAAARQ